MSCKEFDRVNKGHELKYYKPKTNRLSSKCNEKIANNVSCEYKC